jgi:hypothetical protein
MSGDVDAELAELLDEAPDFGASGADFGGDLGAAGDNGGVVGQQTYDAAETVVGPLGRRWLWCASTGPGCAWFRDAGIMREGRGKR